MTDAPESPAPAAVPHPTTDRYQVPHDGPWSIAQASQFESWHRVRLAARRGLMQSVSWMTFYAVASLVIGAYLLLAVHSIGEHTVDFGGWNRDTSDADGLRVLAIGYGVAAIGVFAFWLGMMISMAERAPRRLRGIWKRAPGMGRMGGAIALGELCESVFASVQRSQTYGDALSSASNTLGDADLARWAGQAARALDSGEPIETVLQTVPVQDTPITAAVPLTRQASSQRETILLWRHACEECHGLIETRGRAFRQTLTTVVMLMSGWVALMALLICFRFLASTISSFGFMLGIL